MMPQHQMYTAVPVRVVLEHTTRRDITASKADLVASGISLRLSPCQRVVRCCMISLHQISSTHNQANQTAQSWTGIIEIHVQSLSMHGLLRLQWCMCTRDQFCHTSTPAHRYQRIIVGYYILSPSLHLVTMGVFSRLLRGHRDTVINPQQTCCCFQRTLETLDL